MIRLQFSGDEAFGSATGVPDDDQNAWWSGAQKSFAVIAIAATLAIAATSTQVAAATVDLGGADDVSAGHLSVIHVDEDFYRPPPSWPVVFDYPQPFSFEQNENAHGLYGQPDDDFWQNPAEPVTWPNLAPQPWSFDAGEIAYAPLFAPPEEHFWINPVAPVPAANFQRLPYLPDPEELPAGNLSLVQFDDDGWRNPAAPIVGANLAPQPFAFDQSETLPPPSAPFQADEDFWQAPSPVVAQRQLTQPWQFDQQEICAAPGDEDFWANPVASACWPNRYPQPWGFDAAEFTAPPLPVDELYWQNPTPPVTWPNNWLQPYRDAADADQYSPPVLATDFLYATGGESEPWQALEVTAGKSSQLIVSAGGGVNVVAGE